MKTFTIIEVSRNYEYDGWAGNNSYDLILQDDSGARFVSRAFMDCTDRKAGQELTLSQAEIAFLNPLVGNRE